MEVYLDTRGISPQAVSYAGRVRVRLGPGNLNGRVCNYVWDDVDARIFCRQIGWRDGNTFRVSSSRLITMGISGYTKKHASVTQLNH